MKRRSLIFMAWFVAGFFGCTTLAFAEAKADLSLSPTRSLVSAEGQKKPAPVVKKKSPTVVLPEASLEDEKAEGKMLTMRGYISARNNFGMAVVYSVDPQKGEQELWINFMNKMKFAGFKKLAELQEGDTVEIVYKELEGAKKRILKEIRFIQHKPKEAPAHAEVPAEEAPMDGQSETQP